MNNPKKIFLVIPSFTFGGAERVISQLCFFFAKTPNISVTLICLIKTEKFYRVPDLVNIIEPGFIHTEKTRLIFTIKIFRFLRRVIKEHKPDAILSFGGKYNSFVLLASMGLSSKVFVSDRSQPGISYGNVQDFLNPIMYKRSSGIIAQTNNAKKVLQRSTGHPNIIVIGNPIKEIELDNTAKENIILNVGRFIKSKQQQLLVEYFAKINNRNWKLIFLGDGKYLEAARKRAVELGVEKNIFFYGVVKDVNSFYKKSKIFAFTSISEGFPNALAEALSASLACISFDCVSGPSELIDDGVNGFLIPEGDDELYIQKLKSLMDDATLRTKFGEKGRSHMKEYDAEQIANRYLKFILPSHE